MQTHLQELYEKSVKGFFQWPHDPLSNFWHSGTDLILMELYCDTYPIRTIRLPTGKHFHQLHKSYTILGKDHSSSFAFLSACRGEVSIKEFSTSIYAKLLVRPLSWPRLRGRGLEQIVFHPLGHSLICHFFAIFLVNINYNNIRIASSPRLLANLLQHGHACQHQLPCHSKHDGREPRYITNNTSNVYTNNDDLWEMYLMNEWRPLEDHSNRLNDEGEDLQG